MVVEFIRAYFFSKNANSHVKKMAWISLVGISVGTFSLFLVLSVMAGLNASTEKKLLKSEPHLVIQESNKDINEIKRTLKNIDIENIHAFESQDFLVRTSDGNFSGTYGIGLSEKTLRTRPSFYDGFKDPVIADFTKFNRGEEVLIGPDLAYELKIVVGDNLEIYKPESILKSVSQSLAGDIKTLTVAGVLNSEYDSNEGRLILYAKDKIFNKSLSLTKGFEIYLKNADQTSKAESLLKKINIDPKTWRERNSSLFLALKIEKLTMTLLLGLALLITSFSIMTLLILIVVQKQKDIGIMLSTGFSKKRIRKLYSGMGAGISLFGIFLGGGLGVLTAFLMILFPLKILPPIYQDPYLPVKFDFTTLSWVFIFCVLVALLSSFIPVLYVSRITPVSALKETTKI